MAPVGFQPASTPPSEAPTIVIVPETEPSLALAPGLDSGGTTPYSHCCLAGGQKVLLRPWRP
jgi:hypothetical protein